jgi:hypothetical protein
MVLWAGCGVAPSAAENVSEQQSDLITTSSTIYDGSGSPPTQCSVGGTIMHCCPTNQAMVGAQVDKNVFKCAPFTVPRTGSLFLDTGTQRNGMHSCPLGSVMVGLRADQNRLACQAVVAAVSETVDSSTGDAFPMHICGSGATMSGIRIDHNLFNCASGTNNVATCTVNASCGGACDACNDGSCQCGFITSCADPISPLCQTTNLCANHGGSNPNLTCVRQP